MVPRIITLAIATLLTFYACTSRPTESTDSGQRIKNDLGKYSIVKPTDWDHEIKNRSIKISQARVFDSLEVTGIVIVAPGNSELSLDEMFPAVVNELPASLKDFHKINEGYTEINGHPTRWIKLSHTLYDYKYISLRYYMQLAERTPVMVECSSIDGTFEDFEEEFNKMVFSLRVEK